MKTVSAILFILFLPENIIHAQTTLDSIQGDWTCIMNIQDMSLVDTDETYPNDEKGLTPWGNLRIEKNLLYYFDYPCEFFYLAKINSDTGSLNFIKPDDPYRDRFSLEYLDDTLTVRDLMSNSRKVYIRDKLDNSIIAQLLQDSVHPQSLKQTWYLRKGYDSGYDGLGYVIFEFPYKLPDSLVITKNNLGSFSISGRKIHIPVNGVKRTFHIERFSLKEDVLLLEEHGKWYLPKKDIPLNYRIMYELNLDD